MFRMPSPALMKSLYAAGGGGASSARALTIFTKREPGGGKPDYWRRGTASGSSSGSGFGFRLPVSRTAETVAASKNVKEWRVQSLLKNLNPKFLSSISPVYQLNRRLGGSTMVSSLSQSTAAVASDEGQIAEEDMDKFVDVAHKMADAAGHIIRQFFRTKIDILDKDDDSPVTIADRRAESAMSLLISQHFPTHGIYGEEGGLFMPEERTEYVWVLDPIDGTKSFITGKPLFGTLIALVHKGVPILGIIDQPVLGERWVGRVGKESTLNGEPIASRSSITALKDAYLYSTSPHLFDGTREEAFMRVREKVKTALYGCDCYAYGLLAAGHTDLVVESGLKPYDFLALVPVIEGAGGYITDWEGKSLRFWPNSEYSSVGEGGTEVAAAGSAMLHKAVLAALAWN
ncbi:unnamed protein product [Calypogeia fissa]